MFQSRYEAQLEAKVDEIRQLHPGIRVDQPLRRFREALRYRLISKATSARGVLLEDKRGDPEFETLAADTSFGSDTSLSEIARMLASLNIDVLALFAEAKAEESAPAGVGEGLWSAVFGRVRSRVARRTNGATAMSNVLQCPKRYDAEHLIGTFCDQRHYDILVDEDTDCYAPSLYPTRSEENIVFKFRQNAFTKLEQRLAYDGLRPAAVSSQNRGLAAGPRGEGAGGRDWVAEYQLEALLSLSDQNGANLQAIGNERGAKAECRGYVWLQEPVLADHGDYHGWFDRWFSAITNSLPRCKG